jgi:hypothetical protein
MVVHDDGSIEIEGYDPAYEEMLAAMGDTHEFSVCYQFARHWNEVLGKLEESGHRDRLKESIGETYYDNDRSTGYRDVKRSFEVNDLGEFLAEQLRDYVKEESYDAIPIAQVLANLPVRLDWTPEVHIDNFDEEDGWGLRIVRKSTHTLKVCGVEIAEWQHKTERDIDDIFYFNTSTYDFDKDYGFDDLGPSPFVQEVLQALEIEDSPPDPPDEDALGAPKHDATGKGFFGVMYETRAWSDSLEGGRSGYDDDNITEVEVVVYKREWEARDAYSLATQLAKENGDDHQYRITLVRRRAPSERQVDMFEEQDLDPIYYEWTEMESHHMKFPVDFEG